jgi:hypothetical protein
MMRDRLRRWLPWLALAVLVIGFVNFMWFFAESTTMGDTQRGFIRDGHYYLVHGSVATEVSRERWDWSNLHAASLLVTHPLGMAGGAYLLFTVVFPAMLGGGDPTARRERVERIRSSGVALASTRTGGKIGELRATKPLVRADVHPGGLVISVLGIEPLAIEADALSGFRSERSFGTATVRIIHRQADTPSDIRLYLDDGSPVVEALRGLIADHPAEVQSAGMAADRSTGPAPAPYPTVMKAMLLVGTGLSVVFLVVALPFGRQLGGFGVIWSIGLVLIFGYNLWTYFIRNRDRW